MASFDKYVELAARPNTRRAYAMAVRHYEIEWRGLLPATPDAIAQYLAHYAASLAISTLEARLAGLARWHLDQGFEDPTKATLVRQVLRGIRAAHNAPPRQARPFEFDALNHVSEWLAGEIDAARARQDNRTLLRRCRDQAMLRLGFWRGFRADELSRVRFEHVTVEPGVGLTCFIARTKNDRAALGTTFECPALSRLCPVEAFTTWASVSGLSAGPVFRRIDRWGRVGGEALAHASLVPWLRALLADAGVKDAQLYSSHSLRRGFANWARTSGWDLKALMDYVGWRDVHSAMRYLDNDPAALARRFEQALAASSKPAQPAPAGASPEPARSNVLHLPRRR